MAGSVKRKVSFSSLITENYHYQMCLRSNCVKVTSQDCGCRSILMHICMHVTSLGESGSPDPSRECAQVGAL